MVDIAGALSDKLVIGGALDLSDPNDQIVFNGTPDGTTTYVLATYSSVSGVFDNGSVPAGYQLFYGANELDLLPVPEPGASLLTALGVVALALLARRPRPLYRPRCRVARGKGSIAAHFFGRGSTRMKEGFFPGRFGTLVAGL